jgi:hypothetical protein
MKKPCLLKPIGFCRFVVQSCKYADDLAVYAVHYDVGNIHRSIQSACASRNGLFFRGVRLSISEAKSELVLFSRKHTNPPIYVSLNGRLMPVVPNFRYLGVVFDRKLLLGAHVRYIQQKCFKRINFLRSMAVVSWRAHPDVMLILYKGLIRSVFESGCIAFDRMASTHMLKLERVQYRCLRIALFRRLRLLMEYHRWDEIFNAKR